MMITNHANSLPLHILILLLLSTTVLSSNLRRTTMANELAEFPETVILPPPPTIETSAEKSARMKLIQTVGQKQKMILSTGTSVVVWAPDQLTPQELATAAQTVNHMAKEISDCFCTFRAKKPHQRDGLISSIEAHAEQNCVCAARGKLTEKIPEITPTDFYGTTLPKATTLQSFLRYDVPSGNKFIIEKNDLVLSLDAGDRRSYDASNPSVWQNVANYDGTSVNTYTGHLHGFIGFNNTNGLGSLRLGAHGDRDVVVVPNLDIGKSAMPEVTIEIWLKVSKYEDSSGRAFGNSLDKQTLGGRSLFIHNVLYSTDRSMKSPPSSFDPFWTGKHGRLGATANHLYDSEVMPPKLHEWTQYTTVWSSREVNLYQNGKVVGRESLYGDGDDSVSTLGSRNFCIGNHEFNHKGGKFKLNGYVGLVRVWKRALLSEQIDQLYQHSRDRFQL